MIERLKRLFKAKAKKNRYYALVARARYTNEEIGEETVVCGYLFETYDDAMRHWLDLSQFNESYEGVGVVEINTPLDVTVAKLDYSRTTDHPTPTVTFHRPSQ